MPIDSDLMAMIACPSVDHSPLNEQIRIGLSVLVCSNCHSVYPIRNGIPVMLVDDATPGPNGIGVAADSPRAPSYPPADQFRAPSYPPADQFRAPSYPPADQFRAPSYPPAET